MRIFNKSQWSNVTVSFICCVLFSMTSPSLSLSKVDAATFGGIAHDLLALETTGSIPIGKREFSEPIPQGTGDDSTVTQDPQGEKSSEDQAKEELTGPGTILEEPLVMDPTEMVNDGILKEVDPPAFLKKPIAEIAPSEELNKVTDDTDVAP